MSLEKTVLNEALIKELLYNNYNIAVISITKTNLGSANCYIVSNADNKYFLKEFQSNFESTDLLREAKLVNYLAAQSIPTARFIETVNGRFFFEYANHLICLKEYIDGTTYGYYNFPKEM